MKVWAICEACRHRHPIDFDPLVPTPAFSDWYTKHGGHAGVNFLWPERSRAKSWTDRLVAAFRWERRRPETREAGYFPVLQTPDGWQLPALASFLMNANVNAAYGATVTPTLTLASLAASSTLLAGRESSAIDNGAATKALDYLVAGNFRAGAANNQAGRIILGAVAARDDSPTWPDVFDGTDSTETISKQGIFDAIVRILADIAADNTASQTWYAAKASLITCMGLTVPPDQFVFFVAQSIQTGTNVWSATEGDHAVRYEAISATVV